LENIYQKLKFNYSSYNLESILHVDVNSRPDYGEQHYKGEGSGARGEREWSKGVGFGTSAELM